MRARTLLSSLVAALLTILAWGANAQTIGFSQVGSESDWRTAFSADMKTEAQKRGITLRFSDAQQKQENQIRAVRTFIAQKVDAIIIAPVVLTGWEDVLRQAQDAHIPVFAVNRGMQVDPSLFVTLIAADFNQQGQMAGEWLGHAHNGPCNVIELQGTPGAAPTIERKKGFETAIARFPGIKIVKSETGNFTTAGGKATMETFIKETNGLDGICAVWSHNDNMMLGAIEAMKEAGLYPGRDVLMVSVDGVPNIFRAMLAGEANMSVEQKSDIGKYVYDVVQGYLQGERDYPKQVVIPNALHTSSDAAEMLRRKTG